MTYEMPQLSKIEGLTEDEQADLDMLVDTWWRKRDGNIKRERYYNGKNKLKDLGISIPPSLKYVETVVGWPEKAVDYIADRAVLMGFTVGTDASDELDAVLDKCSFLSCYAQAVTDAMISSCAFLTVTGGEDAPVVSAHSARDASALWDDRLHRLKCGFAVAEFRYDKRGRIIGPKVMNMFTPSDVIELQWTEGNNFVLTERKPHKQTAPLMEPICYKPRLGRPFGKSRISRAVMSITDAAVREALRSEVSAEFFTAPQKYILGAEDTLFQDKSKWEQYIGNWLAITKDEDGDIPQVGQFAQVSMQPHSDYMRTLAARFAGETNVPISSLGVIHDNPSSAEAIYAAKEEAVIDAQNFNRDNRIALARIARLVLAVSRNQSEDELSDDEKQLTPCFMNPAMPSIVSQSDAMVKQISAIPWIGESRVALEQLGYDEEQIRRLMSDKRRAQATQAMQQMAESQNQEHEATMYEVSSIIKSYRSGWVTRTDALHLFGRIGIDIEEAANILDAPEGAEVVANLAVQTGETDDDIERET